MIDFLLNTLKLRDPFALTLLITVLPSCTNEQKAVQPEREALEASAQQTVADLPVCTKQSFPSLPDVTVATVTEESTPAIHCKIAGVIGTEIHFELLLPKE